MMNSKVISLLSLVVLSGVSVISTVSAMRSALDPEQRAAWTAASTSSHRAVAPVLSAESTSAMVANVEQYFATQMQQNTPENRRMARQLIKSIEVTFAINAPRDQYGDSFAEVLQAERALSKPFEEVRDSALRLFSALPAEAQQKAVENFKAGLENDLQLPTGFITARRAPPVQLDQPSTSAASIAGPSAPAVASMSEDLAPAPRQYFGTIIEDTSVNRRIVRELFSSLHNTAGISLNAPYNAALYGINANDGSLARGQEDALRLLHALPYEKRVAVKLDFMQKLQAAGIDLPLLMARPPKNSGLLSSNNELPLETQQKLKGILGTILDAIEPHVPLATEVSVDHQWQVNDLQQPDRFHRLKNPTIMPSNYLLGLGSLLEAIWEVRNLKEEDPLFQALTPLMYELMTTLEDGGGFLKYEAFQFADRVENPQPVVEPEPVAARTDWDFSSVYSIFKPDMTQRDLLELLEGAKPATHIPEVWATRGGVVYSRPDLVGDRGGNFTLYALLPNTDKVLQTFVVGQDLSSRIRSSARGDAFANSMNLIFQPLHNIYHGTRRDEGQKMEFMLLKRFDPIPIAHLQLNTIQVQQTLSGPRIVSIRAHMQPSAPFSATGNRR